MYRCGRGGGEALRCIVSAAAGVKWLAYARRDGIFRIDNVGMASMKKHNLSVSVGPLSCGYAPAYGSRTAGDMQPAPQRNMWRRLWRRLRQYSRD